jgi:hypothetical protein
MRFRDWFLGKGDEAADKPADTAPTYGEAEAHADPVSAPVDVIEGRG